MPESLLVLVLTHPCISSCSLIFPQYDCIAIIFSIFLLTYTYIEARSNYHRGSTLLLA